MADLKTPLSQLLELSRSFQQLMADLDPVERSVHGTAVARLSRSGLV